MGGGLEIKLNRHVGRRHAMLIGLEVGMILLLGCWYNRVYEPGEMISGEVYIMSNGGMSHNGVTVKVEGSVQGSLNASAVSVFDAFSSNIKPQVVIELSKQLQPPGKVPDGKTAIPFEFKLAPSGQKPLLDTYHGIYICIQYTLTVDVAKSGMFGQALNEGTEFIVQIPIKDPPPPKPPVTFSITPETVKKSKGKRDPAQRFAIKGQLDSSTFSVSSPIKGALVVDPEQPMSHPIKSISLQIIRVETINAPEGSMKEASEVQSIQVANGNVAPGLQVPIHVVLPRLFTCPSVAQSTFAVDFEANLIVEFDNGFSPVENIPLKLHR